MLNACLCAKLITYNTTLAIQHSTYAAQLKKNGTNKVKQNKHTNESRSQKRRGETEEETENPKKSVRLNKYSFCF